MKTETGSKEYQNLKYRAIQNFENEALISFITDMKKILEPNEIIFEQQKIISYLG